jgi:hypothetical protein
LMPTATMMAMTAFWHAPAVSTLMIHALQRGHNGGLAQGCGKPVESQLVVLGGVHSSGRHCPRPHAKAVSF